MTRIAVRVRDARHGRIAWAVASHPRAGVVGMIGHKTPSSWKGLVKSVSSLDGYDVIVDPDPEDVGPVAVVATTVDRPSITYASPQGLAKALATRLNGATPCWTTAGRPSRKGRWFPFPAPLGPVLGDGGELPVESEVAGVGAFGSTTLAVVDDQRFLAAATIAAGAMIADTSISRPTPVWERAEEFIAACEELGLVVAESG